WPSLEPGPKVCGISETRSPSLPRLLPASQLAQAQVLNSTNTGSDDRGSGNVSGSAAEASGRCGCGEGTYHGISGSDGVPAIPAIPAMAPEGGGTTPSRTFGPAHLGL